MTIWSVEELRNAARSANSGILTDGIEELLSLRRQRERLIKEREDAMQPVVLIVKTDVELSRKLRTLAVMIEENG